MKIAALLLMMFLFAAKVVGQGHRSATENIRTVDEAIAYGNDFPTVYTQFLCNEFDRSFLGKELDTLKPGDLHTTSFYEVRTVARIEKEIYRFNMISLFSVERPNAGQLVDSMKVKMQEGTTFREIYKTFMPTPPVTQRPPGEMGWVDIDIFEDSLRFAIQSAKLNDVFTVHDSIKGVHHLIWMTDESKKATGPFVVFYPLENATELPMQRINHVDAVKRIQDPSELVTYAKKYQEEVLLELLKYSTEPLIYREIEKSKKEPKQNGAIFHDGDAKHYRWIKDTSVTLYSFQYVYLNGDKLSKKERNDAIHDIYEKFNAGIAFDEIVSEYWPDNKGYSTLENVDGGLLAPDFVTKLNEAKVGELFVARVSQSYFIGITTSPERTEDAFLVLTIPF